MQRQILYSGLFNYISCFKTLKYRNTLSLLILYSWYFSIIVSPPHPASPLNALPLFQVFFRLYVLPQRQPAARAVPGGPAGLCSGLPSGGLHQNNSPLHPRRPGEGVPGAVVVQ